DTSDLPSSPTRRSSDLAARWADTIVCVSEAEHRRGVEAVVRAAYRVIPNGVDLQVFTAADDDERRACRERLGLDPERPLAVCVRSEEHTSELQSPDHLV